MLTAYGAYGEKKMYGKTVQGVIRSTFVVDERARSPKRSTTSRPPATSPSCAATCRSRREARQPAGWHCPKAV